MIAQQVKIGDPVYVVIDDDDEIIGVHVSLVSAKAALESIVEQHGGSVEPKESWQADFVRYTASTNAGNFLGIVIEVPLYP